MKHSIPMKVIMVTNKKRADRGKVKDYGRKYTKVKRFICVRKNDPDLATEKVSDERLGTI